MSEKSDEAIADLKSKLEASEKHNRSLINDKKSLEEELSSAITKCARAEESVLNLQPKLSQSQKLWEAKEKELNDCLAKLHAEKGESHASDASCQSAVPTSFSNIVCNEGKRMFSMVLFSF